MSDTDQSAPRTPSPPSGAGSSLPPPPPADRPWSAPPLVLPDPASVTKPVPAVRYEPTSGVSWPTAPPSDPRDRHGAPLDGPPEPLWTPSASAFPPPRSYSSPPASPGSSHGAPGRRGGRFVFVALLAIVALAAGFVGAMLGVNAADDDEPGLRPTVTTDVSTGGSRPSVAPPITGAVDEPVAEVAQAVGPSVVLISTGVGEGSGIIYDTNGYILTNAHVVGDATRVDVTMADGEIYTDAVVVGADDVRDIAVVQIEPRQDLVAAVFGATADVHVGQTAVAIGSPFGLEQTVTAGVVSAVGRVISAANPVEMIQTDAPINPGNSGGALADAQGRVIGMNTLIIGSEGNVGVGFAIPSDTLLDIARRIVGGESLDIAYLGIRGNAPTGSTAGVVLTEVRPDSPAEQGGLREGDQVTAIDGAPVTNMASMQARIQLHQPGDTIELTIERDDQTLTTTITLSTIPN
jgi:putative serine protease PepD